MAEPAPCPHGTGHSLAAAIERGEVFIVRDGDAIIGTVTVDEFADPEFWTPEDHPADALYIHRMVVTRTARGQDVGGQMIDWALARAESQGKRWLRLDAWRGDGNRTCMISFEALLDSVRMMRAIRPKTADHLVMT